ncbi:P-loop NTPase fold protein [Paraburkholderia sp. J67]|uniref:KAP family P-loop NTPase fold protein n=1 Tax=Paraburkholderia sp. J67 TaxID=2805435 RepID=UPI002ABDCCEF|nr:P-loop NTPase fold protein [Paraburkholderia sp. J67]
MSDANQSRPLSYPAWQFDPSKQPFDGDLLGRQRIANRLSEFVGRLDAGAVIAIDAPWGGGKTWFGRNWAPQLRANGHKVAFVDAFEQDYLEDPFMVIAAELATLLDDSEGSGQLLRGKAAAVMKAILPLGAKILVGAVGRLAFGSADLAEELQDAVETAQDGVADSAEKSIEKKLEEHEKEKRSFVEYRRALAEFAAKQQRPVIVFVDELDRCNPAFAVRLLERVKHFFEIPNVVFVLLLNREQLEQAVKGMFGLETDAAAYLSKFVRFFFRLPPPSTERNSQYGEQAHDFLSRELGRYGFEVSQNRAVDNFHAAAAVWTAAARLSLRDMEKMCALFALSGPIGPAGLLAYLISLKLREPAIFDGLLRGDRESHKAAVEWISDCAARAGFKDETPEAEYLAALKEVHFTWLAPGRTEQKHLTDHIARWIMGERGLSVERGFAVVLARIDLSLEM